MNYNIENFVGIFDNSFDKEYCDFVIDFFNNMDRQGLVSSRKTLEPKFDKTEKNDSILCSHLCYNANHSYDVSKTFVDIFWGKIYSLYAEKYDILKKIDHHNIYSNKIQKTEIGQGYHLWHSENSSREQSNRVLVYTVYLNDVEEGGETEFLYYPKRVKPQQGRTLIFPASFTHTHRGNPPISNEKYIITGWIEY